MKPFSSSSSELSSSSLSSLFLDTSLSFPSCPRSPSSSSSGADVCSCSSVEDLEGAERHTCAMVVLVLVCVGVAVGVVGRMLDVVAVMQVEVFNCVVPITLSEVEKEAEEETTEPG